MMSQLIERLKAELALSTDPIHRAELLARIAAYCARTGNFEASRSCIGDLRSAFGRGQDGRVTIWIMLAEGILQYYSELSPAALDRLSRAQLLAISTRYKPAIAILGAWKAHIEFEMTMYESMFSSLDLGLANVSAGDADAHTRLAMVISNVFMLCGDDRAAQHWFIRGRAFAVPNGDQASIEALLYNRVAFRFADLRAQHCRGKVEMDAIQAMRSEVDSAENLQELVQINALGNHIRLIAARLPLLAEDYGLAMSRLSAVRTEQPFAAHNFSQKFIDLEISLCLCCLGSANDALTLYETIDMAAFQDLDLDEQLVAAWIKKRLSDADARFGDSSLLTAHWRSLSDQYGQFQTDMLEKLRAIVSGHATRLGMAT